MTVLVNNKHNIISLKRLFRLALKSVYDREHLTSKELKDMQVGIVDWYKQVEYQKANIFEGNTLELEDEECINQIAWLLKRDEEGYFDNRKRLFKEKKIDWRKFYRLPEAYTAEGLAQAQKHLEEHKRDNPELY